MYRCREVGCEEKFDDGHEFQVHRSYHDYHRKIRDQGKEKLAQLERKFNQEIRCPLEDRQDGCYYFPQLPSRLVCDWYECREHFLSAEQFYEHVASHAHRSLDKCYWENCNQVFKTMTVTLLKEHLRVHTLQKLYACPTCGNFFSTKIKFDDHFLRHLKLPETISDGQMMASTVAHHKGELKFDVEEYILPNDRKVKLFRCTYNNCDKTFLTSSLLREHIRIHSSKNQCDKCPFKANSVSRLESHKLYRHQTERNYECAICLKTFKQRGDLRAHVRRHQIVEPYRCDKCDFETLNEEGLSKHSKLHSVLNDYKCHICSRVFSRGNNLSRHLKDQHKLEPPNGLNRFRYKLTDGVYFIDSVDIHTSTVEPSDYN